LTDALFIDPKGHYPALLGPDHCWDEARDARTYDGSGPVIAHPPCARWCRLAESIYARTGKSEHLPGNDGGCFASALANVFAHGGVIEHPSSSKAWAHHNLAAPSGVGWSRCGAMWVCEVWQSAYGHLAPKRSWLAYAGKRAPFELNWSHPPGTHAVSGDAVKRRKQGTSARPRLSGKQNIATPIAFAKEMIRLAEWSKGT
jgi:hypothetical protein